MPTSLSLLGVAILAALLFNTAHGKSTIEPCSNSGTCPSMVGYTLYTDLKVSEVASLFSVDPITLLLANAIDISSPDVENHILPKHLFLKIPMPCACVDGIRKSGSVSYKTRPSDKLADIADEVYGGLVSADQIKEANPKVDLSDPEVIGVGTLLSVPLPCTCFNNSDNNVPAVYLSYVVGRDDTLAGVARMYQTTVSDLMNVNALGTEDVADGDILAVPLSACASNFPAYASDYGLVVPNGSYAIVASHCVQCSCGPGSRNLYCMPASLAVSCSSMQCRNSNLMVGNLTAQQTSAGCNVTSCSYGGFVNGSIATSLSTSLQPRCPGPQQFPQLIAPPTAVEGSIFSPAPAPSEAGGIPTTIPSVVPSSSGSFQPANGPSSGIVGPSSDCTSLMADLKSFSAFVLLFGSVFKFLVPL